MKSNTFGVEERECVCECSGVCLSGVKFSIRTTRDEPEIEEATKGKVKY